MASALSLVASGPNKTGLNTLADLFIKAELLELADGSYRVRTDAMDTDAAHPATTAPLQSALLAQLPAEVSAESKQTHAHRRSDLPSIHIDLEIHISPESSPEQIEKVFESISKHLYGKSEQK